MMFIGLMMFLAGLLAFISNRKHVLNMLLSLEYVVLGLLWCMSLFLVLFNNYYVLMYFFVFVVCEGAMGLSLVVLLIRVYGNDLLLNLSLAQC